VRHNCSRRPEPRRPTVFSQRQVVVVIGSELLIQEPRTLGVSGFSTRQRENKVIPKSNSWSS
jgi:hypothetical protein